jgi:nicotinate-nucleotide adenylyltransferase
VKLGIYGGTFNPVHMGHLINAEIIRNDFMLDKILFVPSKYPVHKELSDRTSAENRYDMLKMSIDGMDGLEISRIELDSDGDSYTIYTVEKLLESFPGDGIHLIIGMDSFNEIRTWREYEKLLKMVSVIVMNRPGFERNHLSLPEASNQIEFADNPMIGISSSLMRERVRNGKSIRFMTPAPVMKYIKDKGLYSN